MVATPETLNRFIFNSDYPIDKVVWLYEGSATSPATAGASESTDINLYDILKNNEPVFLQGVYTVDDWQTAYMLGVNQVTIDPYKNVSGGVSWGNWPYSSTATITFSSRTVYSVKLPIKYRIWGIIREDTRSAAEYGKNSSLMKSKLTFNSENNYPRLYKDGIAQAGDVIEHNMGRVPFVEWWAVSIYNNKITSTAHQTAGAFGSSAENGIWATDKDITFHSWSQNEQFYYRIYA